MFNILHLSMQIFCSLLFSEVLVFFVFFLINTNCPRLLVWCLITHVVSFKKIVLFLPVKFMPKFYCFFNHSIEWNFKFFPLLTEYCF